MDLRPLKRIGLTEGEIKVYSALLELGECTKTKLAKYSKIAPSNIYDVTDRLLNKGLISKVEKNGVAHFSPANPKRIIDFLNTKEKEIEKEKEYAKDILPTLLLKFQETRKPLNVEVYNDWKGLKTVFKDLLDECKKGDKNYVFGASKGFSEKKADIFFLKYSKQRAQKGIFTKIIFNKELKSKRRIEFFKKSKYYNIKFLDQATPTEIMLYKDKTCIIILTKEPLVIRVTSKEVNKSFKQYFDTMWKAASV